jgi:hypothetical protein
MSSATHHFAWQQSAVSNVHFVPKADIDGRRHCFAHENRQGVSILRRPLKGRQEKPACFFEPSVGVTSAQRPISARLR